MTTVPASSLSLSLEVAILGPKKTPLSLYILSILTEKWG